MSVARLCAIVALLLSWSVSAAFPQSTTGEIQGTIVDQSGAVLPGVTITIVNTATGATREAITGTDGLFTVTGLPVGPYEVTASLQGFATRRQPDVRVQVGQTVTLRLELGVAAVAETITVAGTAPVVETTRSQVSSVVNATAVANLPTNGRNFIDFVLLTPGVTRDVRTGDISFAGQRGTLNSLVVDGADNNNTFFGQTLGRTGSGRAPYQFSQEAVQEFQVNTNAYSAEYGRAGGAVINVVTKSGTNNFSGSAFEFYRDKALNANTAINEDAIPPRPKSPYHYHQFGGVFGGPIVEDKHFFFGNYDGQRNTQPNDVFLNVPGTAPTDPDTLAAINTLRPLATSWERTQNQDVFLIKTDHQLTGSQRLTLRYNHQNFTGGGFENGGPQTSFQTTGASKVYTRTFNATLASVIGSSLFNEARFQYAKDREPGEANSDAAQATIRQGGTTVLVIGRNFFSPRETTIDRLQFADSLTWVRGAHKLRTGVDLQFDDILNFFPGNFSGVYLFNTLAQFNRGTPSGPNDTFTQAFPGAGTTGPETRPNINEYSVFAQDEWRVNQALTVNAGVRYDLQKFAQPPVRNPDPQLAAAGIDTSVLNTDTNNFGPRVGFAWAPVGGRYVVRGGYGLFYGRTPSIMVGTAHSNNGINVQTITFRGASGDPVPTYPNRFTSIPSGVALPRPTIFTFEPDYQNPRVQQASTGFEWEWMPHTSVSVNYLFVKGDHLSRSTDINIGAPSPTTFTLTDVTGAIPSGTIQHYAFGPGPFTNFTRVISFQSTAESRYNGITLELNRRFAQNHQYRLAYTLGKVEDTVPDATAVVPEGSDDRKFASNPAEFDADRAPGNNDQRHRFVGSAIYSTNGFADSFDGFMKGLLSDWTLSVIYTAQSGQPHSAYASTDINRDNNRFNDLAPGTTRNQFRLPASFSLDPRIARDIRFGETRLTLIWEAFNLLDTANYNAVNVTLYNVAGTQLRQNPQFGQRLAQTDPRVMQLAVKLSF